MIFVNYKDCNGCGVCLDACTFDAILLQNEKATIDQDLCDGCRVCIETCPQGAIVFREIAPVPEKVVMVPEVSPVGITPIKTQEAPNSFRSLTLPALGSVLLWTGREIIPRLANLALNYLDQRIGSADPGLTNKKSQLREQRTSMPGGGRRRRQRQRRNRRM